MGLYVYLFDGRRFTCSYVSMGDNGEIKLWRRGKSQFDLDEIINVVFMSDVMEIVPFIG